MTMGYRVLGPSGLRVSQLTLGAMSFGGDQGASLDESRRILDAYAAAGGNLIDTANRYTDGDSERIVGELLGADRDHFVVSTKYTLSIDPQDPNASGNHRLSMVRSVEQSLRRLRTDRIDLLWVHIWDRLTPLEETMRALDDLVRAGKVLYVGMSDTPAWAVSRAQTLAEWRGWSPLVAIQVPYSLVWRDIERELLPMSRALGLSVLAWSPLAGGVLSGRYTRGGDRGPGRVDAGDVDERSKMIARAVDTAADELEMTSSQVALAWIMARGPTIHPILGGRRLAHLAENLAAVDCALPIEVVDHLDEVSAIELGFPTDFIAGTREFVYGPVGSAVEA